MEPLCPVHGKLRPSEIVHARRLSACLVSVARRPRPASRPFALRPALANGLPVYRSNVRPSEYSRRQFIVKTHGPGDRISRRENHHDSPRSRFGSSASRRRAGESPDRGMARTRCARRIISSSNASRCAGVASNPAVNCRRRASSQPHCQSPSSDTGVPLGTAFFQRFQRLDIR